MADCLEIDLAELFNRVCSAVDLVVIGLVVSFLFAGLLPPVFRLGVGFDFDGAIGIFFGAAFLGVAFFDVEVLARAIAAVCRAVGLLDVDGCFLLVLFFAVVVFLFAGGFFGAVFFLPVVVFFCAACLFLAALACAISAPPGVRRRVWTPEP